MAIYIKFNNSEILYPASITGRINDKDWDNRESKAIHTNLKYEDVINLFTDDVEWSIVQDVENQIEQIDEEGNAVIKDITEKEIYDNSNYCILGDIITHKDGSTTVKMGKPTAEEILNILLGEA